MADASDLFDSSLEAVRDTLSIDDRASFRKFANHTAMIGEIRLMMVRHEHKSRLTACCRKIATFSKAFEPYFQVVGIFVSIKPEWAAWFWGLIRIVFLLGSNLVKFLENVSDMFERIAFTLPQYQTWFEICRRGIDAKDNDRLGQAMSFIYADIIDFSLHVYRIFSRIQRGSTLIRRTTMSGSLLWKPFQSRFLDVLERLEKHQAWFETETKIQQHDLITRHHETFLQYLKTAEEKTAAERRKDLAEQEKAQAKQVAAIRDWLSSPRYRDVYERTRHSIHPSSGQNFLQCPRYLLWRDAGFGHKGAGSIDEAREDWLQRTLFVQAKPGFGKTFISCLVIDDLLENGDALVPEDQDTPAVAFFHFSSTDRWASRSPVDALQSIASQLVNYHRRNKLTIDALEILMNEIGSGQHQASMDDVLALLGILLRQHPTFLVIDAVDECENAVTFLELLKKLCRSNDCRVLLLSRPTITLPLWFTSLKSEDVESCVFSLPVSLNFSDIKSFLDHHLSCMADGHLFGLDETIDLETISVDLTNNANGMFLWARLLVNYLYCSAVTPLERRYALYNPARLEGLEQLYDCILEVLGKSSQKEQTVAGNVFQWISDSLIPLNTRAMHTALAIVPGTPTNKLHHLSDFPDCIPIITCALVEITDDANLSFIHLSFKEYLESKDGAFSLKDKAAVNMHLAMRCLSFLACDVPAKPLQQPKSKVDGDTPPQAGCDHREATMEEQEQMLRSTALENMERKYPLLRYAALSWYTHLQRAHPFVAPAEAEKLYNSQSEGPSNILERNDSWIPILARFLVRRYTVTMWVEACCVFRFLPRLNNLATVFDCLMYFGSADTAAGRESWWVAHSLQQLAGAVEHLHERYNEALMENPTLIWQSQITTAIDRTFWPVWDQKDAWISPQANGREGDVNSGFRPDYRNIQATNEVTYPTPEGRWIMR